MGKYFTERERYQLEGFLKAEMKVQQITQLLGKSKSTIYNEIKRGKVTLRNSDWTERTEYCADAAQRKYNENKTMKGAKMKIGSDYRLAQYIEMMIMYFNFSPYAVSQSIRKCKGMFSVNVCAVTIYHYIDKGIFMSLTNKHLPIKSQPKKQDYKRTVSLNNKKGRSIEERPREIYKRLSYGHWEMDTVVGGKSGRQCLLVLSERASREEIIIRIPNKKSVSVVRALDRIEKKIGTKQFRNMFQTITMDNGVEFLDMDGIERGHRNKKKNRTTVYYCHPYSSYERGTNENTNKLIRRFIPKGANIEDYTDEQIIFIENWINNYPRKELGGLSALEKKKEVTA